MIKIKAFTLIELILTLIVSSIIAVYAFQSVQRNYFYKDMVKFQEKIKFIVNDGITSPLGYASGSGGNCSSDFTFNGLDTQRLADCLYWNTDDLKTNGASPVALIGIDLMQNYGQCIVQTKVKTGDDHSFYVFVDCSSLNIDNKQISRIEESIKFVFENDLSSIHINTSDNSLGLNSNTGGNNEDGQIRAEFKL